MKAEIEARIAALEAELAAKKQSFEGEVVSLESAITAERARLTSWIESIPAEFHHITQEVFDKIATFFHGKAEAQAAEIAPATPAAPQS